MLADVRIFTGLVLRFQLVSAGVVLQYKRLKQSCTKDLMPIVIAAVLETHVAREAGDSKMQRW